MNETDLAQFIVVTLTPYLAMATEQFAKEFGKETLNQIKKTKIWLWKKISRFGDQKTKQTLSLYESDPETFELAMQSVLIDYLKQNPNQIQELNKMVSSLTSGQKSKANISISGNVTGMIVGDHGTIHQSFKDKD